MTTLAGGWSSTGDGSLHAAITMAHGFNNMNLNVCALLSEWSDNCATSLLKVKHPFSEWRVEWRDWRFSTYRRKTCAWMCAQVQTFLAHMFNPRPAFGQNLYLVGKTRWENRRTSSRNIISVELRIAFVVLDHLRTWTIFWLAIKRKLWTTWNESFCIVTCSQNVFLVKRCKTVYQVLQRKDIMCPKIRSICIG